MRQHPAVRVVAEIRKPLEEALDGFIRVESAEIVGAEVRVANAVGEHAPHGGED